MVSERKQSKENSVDSRDGEVRTGVRLPSSPLDLGKSNPEGSTPTGLAPFKKYHRREACGTFCFYK